MRTNLAIAAVIMSLSIATCGSADVALEGEHDQSDIQPRFRS